MKRLWNSHTGLVVRRVALLYVVLALCRLLFYAYNSSLLAGEGSCWMLLKGALMFDTVSILYAEGLWLLLALLPLPLPWREHPAFQRTLTWLYGVVGSLVVALNLSDAVYFRYTEKRITADEIFFAENENTVQLLLKFVAENWFMVLAWVALTLLIFYAGAYKAKPKAVVRRPLLYYPSSLLILAAVVGLAIGGIRGGFTRMTRPITLSNATLYASTPARANLILSNPFCILRTASSNSKIVVPNYFPQEVADTLFSPYHYPQVEAAAPLAGRNVVIFIMESMSAEHSAHLRPDLYAELSGKGFTPFLDSLMREGYCFERMYANGTRSIQAMPSVLGSIPSFKTPFVLMPQALGESRQLPAMLRDQGYETAFFCGSERGSMGFGAYARSAGVERLYAREEYEERHGKGDFDGYWGIWDHRFLDFFGEELSSFQEPFMASIFTLTSHHPFVVPESLKDLLPEGYTPIHRCAAYEDWAYRQFFEKYSREEWFRRTLFVFVADHVSSEKWSEEAHSYPGTHHIFGFMYAPESELQGALSEPVQQIDLMPTILGLVGNREPYFAFGRDLFLEPDRPHWSVSYSNGYQLVGKEGPRRFSEGELPDDEEARMLKALIQHYYSHIAEQSYVVK
uniref:LTA synthase family protein n=1 Tax=Alistipes sp. TaxID=1872444 RepID=UPI0040573C90